MVIVVYTGRNSKLRHRGRTRTEYVFQRGQGVVVDDKVDAKFFMGKAKKNPETWKIVDPRKKAPAKESPKEESPPAEEKEAEETPKEEAPEEDPKPKAPAKKEGEK